jgi:hypothetical protein
LKEFPYERLIHSIEAGMPQRTLKEALRVAQQDLDRAEIARDLVDYRRSRAAQ